MRTHTSKLKFNPGDLYRFHIRDCSGYSRWFAPMTKLDVSEDGKLVRYPKPDNYSVLACSLHPEFFDKEAIQKFGYWWNNMQTADRCLGHNNQDGQGIPEQAKDPGVVVMMIGYAALATKFSRNTGEMSTWPNTKHWVLLFADGHFFLLSEEEAQAHLSDLDGQVEVEPIAETWTGVHEEVWKEEIFTSRQQEEKDKGEKREERDL